MTGHTKVYGFCENHCLVEVKDKATLEAEKSAIEADITALETADTGHEGRLDAIESDIDDIQDDITAIETKNTQQDTAIAGKVDIAQGAINAGKVLGIDDSGNVTPVSSGGVGIITIKPISQLLSKRMTSYNSFSFTHHSFNGKGQVVPFCSDDGQSLGFACYSKYSKDSNVTITATYLNSFNALLTNSDVKTLVENMIETNISGTITFTGKIKPLYGSNANNLFSLFSGSGDSDNCYQNISGTIVNGVVSVTVGRYMVDPGFGFNSANIYMGVKFLDFTITSYTT